MKSQLLLPILMSKGIQMALVQSVWIDLFSFIWSIIGTFRESSGRKSLQDRLWMWEFSWWLSLKFSVLSYSTVQPTISIFGLCLTQCLCRNIQSFYWACPFDSGSRRRANRLEKRSLSRPRHISLHHSHSSERRTVIPLRFLWIVFFSAFWILRAPNLPPTPSPRGVRYKSACHPRWH